MCTHCHTMFTTRETVDYSGSIVVSKNSGHLEPFSRDKLFLSIYDSLRHRKSALRDATALCETVISRLLPLQVQGELKITVITGETDKILKRFDKAAATHYHAFHPIPVAA